VGGGEEKSWKEEKLQGGKWGQQKESLNDEEGKVLRREKSQKRQRTGGKDYPQKRYVRRKHNGCFGGELEMAVRKRKGRKERRRRWKRGTAKAMGLSIFE